MKDSAVVDDEDDIVADVADIGALFMVQAWQLFRTVFRGFVESES